MNISSTLVNYKRLIRADKPIGTLLLLWPCLLALLPAEGIVPEYSVIAVFVIGVFVMRSAGCIINDIADIKFDKYVTRTKDRPLTNGDLPIAHAWALFCLFILAAFLLVLSLKPGTVLLSLGALFVAVLYPWGKRWFRYPQFILGIAFSWSIPMVYYEITSNIPLGGIYLWLACICWVIAYDTIYAMVDREDDLKIGINSSAISFGENDVKSITRFYGLFFIGLGFFAFYMHLGLGFYIGLVMTIAYWFRYIFTKYKTRQPEDCFQAFLNNNKIGIILFASLAFATTSKIPIS